VRCHGAGTGGGAVDARFASAHLDAPCDTCVVLCGCVGVGACVMLECVQVWRCVGQGPEGVGGSEAVWPLPKTAPVLFAPPLPDMREGRPLTVELAMGVQAWVLHVGRAPPHARGVQGDALGDGRGLLLVKQGGSCVWAAQAWVLHVTRAPHVQGDALGGGPGRQVRPPVFRG